MIGDPPRCTHGNYGYCYDCARLWTTRPDHEALLREVLPLLSPESDVARRIREIVEPHLPLAGIVSLVSPCDTRTTEFGVVRYDHPVSVTAR